MANVKVMTGKVVSTKMQKTIVVAVEKVRHHALYDKTMRHTIKYKAHCEEPCDVGDTVSLVESRPLSREKRWRVEKVVAKRPAA